MQILDAIKLVTQNVDEHKDRYPELGTLLEEIGEYARAIEGKHLDHPGLELVQIAGIAINMLKMYGLAEVSAAIELRNAKKNGTMLTNPVD